MNIDYFRPALSFDRTREPAVRAASGRGAAGGVELPAGRPRPAQDGCGVGRPAHDVDLPPADRRGRPRQRARQLGGSARKGMCTYLYSCIHIYGLKMWNMYSVLMKLKLTI